MALIADTTTAPGRCGPLRHQAILELPIEILAEILALPPGARVIDCERRMIGENGRGPMLAIIVEHKDIPATRIDCVLPVINAEYRSIRVPEFVRWSGLPTAVAKE